MSKATDIWSRRRAGVTAEAEADEKCRQDAIASTVRADLEEKSDAEILAELDLPDPDQMGEGDDFAAFMKAVVPERIRKRALRKLWLSNPVLANVDNLVDYGEDFTASGGVVEAVRTTYEVGKGLLAHVEAMEREAETKADMQDVSAPPPQETPEAMVSDEAELEGTGVEPPEEIEEPDETPVTKRRMRFEFAG